MITRGAETSEYVRLRQEQLSHMVDVKDVV